ncbi:hypothetical protein MKB54_001215 [Salmonella enterica]|nr:hypothetical protein [Salmonella enterica]EAW1160983.1 hypothetical protein [Salmonella enterica subsp. enterica]EBK1956718.1 hypothetical protein [Salmonella enterica subsp. enterica serovar Newport]ECG3787190.1 hypothetical protein [Salmonella enterica subsp. enterica serovar Florida]EDC6305789.1 hypothetical protein [Salmonella enterica subsp. enterica serovar Bareilly]HCM1845983.1 hypothetical protein [Salmonella enterica subsp. diarizonae serovar 16:z10:e,n,x,z15]
MRKNRDTARIQNIRLSQIGRQRGGLMVIEGFSYNEQGVTPDNINNRYMRRMAQSMLRRERKI